MYVVVTPSSSVVDVTRPSWLAAVTVVSVAAPVPAAAVIAVGTNWPAGHGSCSVP